MRSAIEQQVRDFIAESFMFRVDRSDIAGDESLLEAGIVDSTGILELVAFLETTFAIQLADDEIVPDNLDSIDALTAFVTRKCADAESADAPAMAVAG